MFPFIDLFSLTRFRSRANVPWHPVTKIPPSAQQFPYKTRLVSSLLFFCSYTQAFRSRSSKTQARYYERTWRQRLRISTSQIMRISLRLIFLSEYRTLVEIQVQYSDCYAPMNCWNFEWKLLL